MNVRDAQRCQRKYLEMKDWSKFHVVKTTMRRESQVWRFRDSKVHITDMFGCMANIGTLHLSSKCLGRGRTNWLGGAPNHLQKVGGGHSGGIVDMWTSYVHSHKRPRCRPVTLQPSSQHQDRSHRLLRLDDKTFAASCQLVGASRFKSFYSRGRCKLL